MSVRNRRPARGSAKRWLQAAVGRIVSRARPEKIVLFGSRARGRPRRDSDFDLLVIARGPRDPGRSYDLVDEAIGEHLWPVDLLVCRPDEVRARLRIGDSFFSEVLRQGTVLYES